MMENGRNNGMGLFLSVRDAADRMGVADLHAAVNAFNELQDLGFIDMTHEAHFAVKAGEGSRARFWRLTWEAVNGVRGPSNEFVQRQPEPKSKAHRRMEKGLRALKRWMRKSQSSIPETGTHIRKCVADFASMKRSETPIPTQAVVENATQNLRNGGKLPITIVQESTSYTAVPAGFLEAAEQSLAEPQAG
jgi:hypothetical protein